MTRLGDRICGMQEIGDKMILIFSGIQWSHRLSPRTSKEYIQRDDQELSWQPVKFKAFR